VKENLLSAEVRQDTGKGAARKLRAKGIIPAVMYGEDTDPVPLSISDYDFSKLISKAARSSMIIDLTVGDSEPQKVIIREVQTDPVSSKINCVDFKKISMDKEITLLLPITLVGTPVGVKDQGGILQTIRREIEISCLPGNIPEKVELDVSELSIGDSLHYEDIKLEGVEVISDPELTVATVVAPTVMKEKVEAVEGEELEEGEEVEAAEGEEEGAEPEVIGEKGKEEEKEKE
jgi:large subunit ribosomal protein L25